MGAVEGLRLAASVCTEAAREAQETMPSLADAVAYEMATTILLKLPPKRRRATDETSSLRHQSQREWFAHYSQK